MAAFTFASASVSARSYRRKALYAPLKAMTGRAGSPPMTQGAAPFPTPKFADLDSCVVPLIQRSTKPGVTE